MIQINNYKILKKKKSDDYNFWMYNLDLDNLIKRFAANYYNNRYKLC